MKIFYRILPVVVIWISACHSEQYKPLDYGLNFAPLEKGLFQVYSVDETVYAETTAPQHNVYQLKFICTDSFPNTEGSYTYVISRFKRSSATAPWTEYGTWSAKKSDTEYIVREGNVAFVRLTFPVKDDLRWNGNRYNTSQADDYSFGSVDSQASVGDQTFDKTVTVVEEDNDDYIFFLDQRKSIYARDIGLIARYVTQLSYCTDDNCRGQQKIKSGIVFKQEILEYGHE